MRKGSKHSKETLLKLSNVRKGKKHGHKTSHGGGWHWTEESKKRASRIHTGKKMSDEAKKKMSLAFTGRKYSLETRKKMGMSRRGEKHHNWKGGVSIENKKIRGQIEYKLWRTAVFERDNYTCVWCGNKSSSGKNVYLEADHIKPFAYYPELRFAIDNGRTLCKECHKKTDTYAGKIKNKKNV